MIFTPTRTDDINELLEQISEEIKVPEGRQQEAKDRYMAVGNWLDADDSPLHEYSPKIHPQGSFAIGTAIRPVEGEEYDVDTVCLLTKTPKNITQQQLKSLVGNRLKQNATYARMLDPVTGGRRCWTLKYAEGTRFHLDILPAIPDPELPKVYIGTPLRFAETAILITDRTTWHKDDDWPKSNPEGYMRWFHQRMQVALIKAKQARAIALKANVSTIQDYEVQTPLQQAIQLLKRHRDINHAGDEDKPISIIITTLAAQAYENEATVFETLQTIIPRMRAQLRRDQRSGVWWVANPVNLEENFADKWEGAPNKARVFFDWLITVEREFEALLTDEGYQDIGNYLVHMFGTRDATKAITRYNNIIQKATPTGISRRLPQSARDLITFNVSHRRSPTWPFVLQGTVTITGQWRVAGAWKPIVSAETNVPRGASVHFQAQTKIPKPYDVFWQVVNTGADARRANCLRGEITPAQDINSPLEHSESTQYRGRHWVECLLVKNGVCVARSEPFVVNIV